MTVKVGDKVRALVNETDLKAGNLYEVTKVGRGTALYVKDDVEDDHYLLDGEYEEVADVTEEPAKGTLPRLLIEALPQGGYTVTAPGHTWATHHEALSAHTTLADAVAFITRNMK